MDEKDFIYWLHGFFELSDSKSLTEAQIQMIKEHISLVLKKVTPPASMDLPEKKTRIY